VWRKRGHVRGRKRKHAKGRKRGVDAEERCHNNPSFLPRVVSCFTAKL